MSWNGEGEAMRVIPSKVRRLLGINRNRPREDGYRSMPHGQASLRHNGCDKSFKLENKIM